MKWVANKAGITRNRGTGRALLSDFGKSRLNSRRNLEISSFPARECVRCNIDEPSHLSLTEAEPMPKQSEFFPSIQSTPIELTNMRESYTLSIVQSPNGCKLAWSARLKIASSSNTSLMSYLLWVLTLSGVRQCRWTASKRGSAGRNYWGAL